MAEIPNMKLTVDGLEQRSEVVEIMARFGQPVSADTRKFIQEHGLDDCESGGCMSWIWYQWLQGTSVDKIRRRVDAFVERGMEMQEISHKLHGRPRHDLYLLHCAIFASSESQLNRLAEQVVDTSGYKKYKPSNDGEMYECAWCGLVKHWILGNRKKAAQQSKVVWSAYRFPNLRAATKPLVVPWLEEDWESFRKQQERDFGRLWDRAHKDRWTVRKETREEIVVTIAKYFAPQDWCWAHCGMAMLAHRQGVEVRTEAFWFPAHALRFVNRNRGINPVQQAGCSEPRDGASVSDPKPRARGH